MGDNISWPRNVIYSHFFAKKCYVLTFLRQETLSASGVGDHVSSSKNRETDNGYKKRGDRAFLLGTFLARISAASVLGRFLFCGHCVVVSGFLAMLAMPLFMRNASAALL